MSPINCSEIPETSQVPDSQEILPKAQMWEASGYDFWIARQFRLIWFSVAFTFTG